MEDFLEEGVESELRVEAKGRVLGRGSWGILALEAGVGVSGRR